MGLNWDLTRIKNYKAVTRDPNTRGLLRTVEDLIWLTIPFGLGGVTEKNVEEWKWRLAFLKTVTQDEFYAKFNTEFLKGLVGLTTNATQLTRAQWVKKWLKNQTLEADYQARNWQ
jgi:hypothetical protein